MDGKGRALDNIIIERVWRSVKCENLYLNIYENGAKLFKGLTTDFEFYNNVRLNKSLNYETSSKIYNVAA